jgi:hypothetical protein
MGQKIHWNVSAATIEKKSSDGGLKLTDTMVKALMTNDKLYVTISIYSSNLQMLR